MTRRLALFLVWALALCLAPAAAMADGIKLYDDFPKTQPGENSLFPQYSPTEDPAQLTGLIWVADYKFARTASGAAPIVEKDFAEGAVRLTPATGLNAVLTWKAPEAGDYLLTGSFRLGCPPDDMLPVSIRLGTPPDDQREVYAAVLGRGSTDPAEFVLRVSLTEDCLVSFLVAPGSATTCAALLQGDISPVPLPGSLLLLGTGLLGLGAAGWRRGSKG